MLLIADHSFNNVSLLNRNDYLEQKVMPSRSYGAEGLLRRMSRHLCGSPAVHVFAVALAEAPSTCERQVVSYSAYRAVL
jgi:hypothetical protein